MIPNPNLSKTSVYHYIFKTGGAVITDLNRPDTNVNESELFIQISWAVLPKK